MVAVGVGSRCHMSRYRNGFVTLSCTMQNVYIALGGCLSLNMQYESVHVMRRAFDVSGHNI